MAKEVNFKRFLSIVTLSLTTFLVASFFTSPHAFAEKLYKGSFVGLSGHKTSGDITISKTSKGYVVKLERNFRHDGAPDPRFGFGNSGKYDNATTFSRLKKNNGSQSYVIPSSVNIKRYNEFYLWCKKFSVPLGKVTLTQVGEDRSGATQRAPRGSY